MLKNIFINCVSMIPRSLSGEGRGLPFNCSSIPGMMRVMISDHDVVTGIEYEFFFFMGVLRNYYKTNWDFKGRVTGFGALGIRVLGGLGRIW